MLQFGIQPEDVADRFNKRPRRGGKLLKREASGAITVEGLFNFIKDQGTACSASFFTLLFPGIRIAGPNRTLPKTSPNMPFLRRNYPFKETVQNVASVQFLSAVEKLPGRVGRGVGVF